MTRLGDKETDFAWRAFKKYLSDVGLIQDGQNLNLAQMAYKQGFVEGAVKRGTSNLEEQVKEIKKQPLITFGPSIGNPSELKNAVEKVRDRQRSTRGDKTRMADNRMIEALLKEKGEEMQLSEIIEMMNKCGRDHWTTNNGSGFMKAAIQDGAAIKWVKRGVYAHNDVQPHSLF